MSGPPRRFDVFLANLDPTLGAEIRKARPALVVSPDEINRHLRTLIVAPMTTTARRWPTRVTVVFDGREAEVALDQVRAIDKARLVRRLGRLDADACARVTDVLTRMFAAE